MIKQMQRDAAYTRSKLGAAAMVGAQTQAMRDAANNANGAAMGFVGLNAANAAGGVNANALYQQAASQPAAAAGTASRDMGMSKVRCYQHRQLLFFLW
jgi:hypothetical protein